jgi:uncharacterized protein (TIGR03437 family)
LWNPQGIAIDAGGNLFLADRGNDRVRKIGAAGIITTVAGNGGFQYGGDGADARSAYLHYPRGIATSPTGDLYIADTLNNRIREVNAQGIISTIVGTGSLSFSGDGGPASAATLSAPYGVARDALGNVFIADTMNTRVRKVDTTGTINTVLGGANGVAVDGENDLFTTDVDDVYELTASGSASIAAGDRLGDGAPFKFAMGLATDAVGDIFVADYGQNRIFEVWQDGTIATIAGNGEGAFSGDGALATAASLNMPSGVAVDGSGNVFIADAGNHRVRMVNTSGIISTVAGTGQAAFFGDGDISTNAALNTPQGVAVDISGDLYIADSGNNRIRMVTGVAAPLRPVVIDLASAATSQSGGIAPGSLITIYGSNFATGISQASQWPLPQGLGGTQATLGGEALPISYASPGQLNVQVPFTLPTSGLFQLQVIRGASASPPVQVESTIAQPAIFTLNQSGSGQGIITGSDGVTLAQPGTPAHIGETVVIYCTGLGAVVPAVATGAAAPASPLSFVEAHVDAQIGNQPATVAFAGLAPGFAGLYQVNAVIPGGIQTGDAVPIVLTVGARSSMPVTIAVR